MARVYIIGVILAVAFTLFGLVDAAMADQRRARGLPKPVWIVVIVVLPVIGALLWFTIGKGPVDQDTVAAPDDDPDFTGRSGGSRDGMSQNDVDRRMRELEKRLRELDDESYPGENEGDSRS
jgi:hypothetical protein